MTEQDVNAKIMSLYFAKEGQGWKEELAPFSAPDFMHNIALSMRLWMKLRESGRFCCLKIDSDYKLIDATKEDPDDGHEPTIHVEVVTADQSPEEAMNGFFENLGAWVAEFDGRGSCFSHSFPFRFDRDQKEPQGWMRNPRSGRRRP
jgi:hypothetical protein